MSRQLSRTVSALALVLATGGATPAATPRIGTSLQALAKVQEPARIAQAQNHLRSLRSQLGLSAPTDFQVRNAFTNEQGNTIVHLRQTHLGHPVESGSAIVHVGPDGVIQKVIPSLAAGIQLSGAPTLTPDQAKAIALKNLAPKGPLDGAPQVTQLVFPSSRTGGYATRLDPATNRIVLDKDMSIWAKRPAADYVWAYAVGTSLRNALDGMKQISYIIDGNTGAILRKWNALKSDSPAQGTGNSLYNGTVVLTTTQASVDHTFSLIDPIRGTQPNNSYATGGNVGLTTFYDAVVFSPSWGGLAESWVPYTGNPVNTWGDGLIFGGSSVYTDPATGGWWWDKAPDANGQTAAVDAQFGMATTWDLFLNVFGRNGMDNLGGTIDAVVHDWLSASDGSALKDPGHYIQGGIDYQAFPDGGPNVMFLGDGAYPQDPNGRQGPQTEIDIVAHEMTHVFSLTTANFDSWALEPQALDEATCDIFAQATKAYALRAPGADTTIPDFPTSSLTYWTFGFNADRGNPERFFYQPSLDGISPDGWYDGVGFLIPWKAAGPINRMFFFLVKGASAVATEPTYSAFMPGGMTGIGLDKATRIWHKAITEGMLPECTMHDAVAAAEAAATALYGEGSPEALAVLQAFYAVNLGDGAPGQPKHVLVTAPVLHAAGTLLGDGGSSFNGHPPNADAKIQFFPPRTPVNLQISVQNTANTAVTWSLGSLLEGYLGGTINPDGTWTTPAAPSINPTPFILTATSQADPAQFAKVAVLTVAIDADLDTEDDALDLGQIAMTWGVPPAQNPYPTTSIWSGGNTGDWDVALFSEILTHTWPAQQLP